MEARRDDVARIVAFTVTGTVTAEEVLAALDDQAAQGTWSYGVLYDERDAQVALTADGMRRITARAMSLTRTHGARGPIAIVAREGVDYGVNRMASAYAEAAGYELEVFRSVERALEWLAAKRPFAP